MYNTVNSAVQKFFGCLNHHASNKVGWLKIVESAWPEHTCAFIMLFNQHLDAPPFSGDGLSCAWCLRELLKNKNKLSPSDTWEQKQKWTLIFHCGCSTQPLLFNAFLSGQMKSLVCSWFSWCQTYLLDSRSCVIARVWHGIFKFQLSFSDITLHQQ